MPWAPIDPAAARELQRADDAPAHGLHRLLDAVAPIDELTAFSAPSSFVVQRWTPVIDADRRPVGLLTADSALTGGLIETLVANVHSTPAEVASRLSTAATEPGAPVTVVDNAGRYLGLLPLRRVLAHFGGGASA